MLSLFCSNEFYVSMRTVLQRLRMSLPYNNYPVDAASRCPKEVKLVGGRDFQSGANITIHLVK